MDECEQEDEDDNTKEILVSDDRSHIPYENFQMDNRI